MRVVMLGFGTVGQSFIRMILERRVSLVEYGVNPKIVAAVDSRGAVVDESGLNLREILRFKRLKGTVSADSSLGKPDMSGVDVLREVEAEAMIEVTPTDTVDGEPGLTHIREALRHGLHVVTANKGPLALSLPALMELADYNGVQLRFSGSVGGGTPILDLGRELFGNRINSIKGILNGTTNYILSRMADAGLSLEEALKEAQTIGYAEADPSYDLDGIDSACKLVIMANWIMHVDSSLRDVEMEGISDVSPAYVRKAESKRMKVKLVASMTEGRLKVKPQPISSADPLCVDGTLNAVTFETEPAGDVTIIGKGAGGAETASAILRDLAKIRVEAVKMVV